MFERNKVDVQSEKGTVSAQITLDDGRVLKGKFIIPVSKSIFDVLNGSGGFIEFEPFDDERQFVAKQALRAVKLLAVPRCENLNARVRNLDGFDPHAVLGVSRGADWDVIRQAYLSLSKEYHPDRYSMADLPEEVAGYLSTMSRRVNAAYAALENDRMAVSRKRAPLAEAIYTSPPRG